jgi:hypothetical protein
VTPSPSFRRPTPFQVLLCASLVMALALAVRQSLGVFLVRMTSDGLIGREGFSIGIGLQNLIWALTGPLAGWYAQLARADWDLVQRLREESSPRTPHCRSLSVYWPPLDVIGRLAQGARPCSQRQFINGSCPWIGLSQLAFQTQSGQGGLQPSPCWQRACS